LVIKCWRINDLKRELDAIGCHVPLEPHGQGFKDMSPAVDVVERLIIQRKLRHGAHPVLQWCAANAVVTRDPAGGRKFDKAKSTGRIDALVALAMALSLALLRATPLLAEARARRPTRGRKHAGSEGCEHNQIALECRPLTAKTGVRVP
jgi:phage terminase large subunit-like protein